MALVNFTDLTTAVAAGDTGHATLHNSERTAINGLKAALNGLLDPVTQKLLDSLLPTVTTESLFKSLPGYDATVAQVVVHNANSGFTCVPLSSISSGSGSANTSGSSGSSSTTATIALTLKAYSASYPTPANPFAVHATEDSCHLISTVAVTGGIVISNLKYTYEYSPYPGGGDFNGFGHPSTGAQTNLTDVAPIGLASGQSVTFKCTVLDPATGATDSKTIVVTRP